jgi:hypothetical protein
MRQREMHKAFEQLANSDVVEKQRKTLQSPDPYATVAKPISGLPPGAILKPIPPPPSGYAIDPSTGERISTNCDYDALAKKYGGTSERPNFIPNGCLQTSGVDVDWSNSIPLPSKVSKGGIETINWNHDYGVASIETPDGQTLYPTAAPSAWLYLLIALLPLLGFFIPWGVVRGIGWVGVGFVTDTK